MKHTHCCTRSLCSGERLGEAVAGKAGLRAGEHLAEAGIKAGVKAGVKAGEHLTERAAVAAAGKMGERIGNVTGGGSHGAGVRTGDRALIGFSSRRAGAQTSRAEDRQSHGDGDGRLRRRGGRLRGLLPRGLCLGALGQRRACPAGRPVGQAGRAGAEQPPRPPAAAVAGAAVQDRQVRVEVSLERETEGFGCRTSTTVRPPSSCLRGFVVALPAIGALFVAHLAKQDYERMIEEAGRGERRASALAFLLAFACDVVRLPCLIGFASAGLPSHSLVCPLTRLMSGVLLPVKSGGLSDKAHRADAPTG